MKLQFIRNLGKNILIQVLSFVVIVAGIGIVYAWSTIDRNTAATGERITSVMMQGIIDRVNDALVPTGAVVAFNLATCPTGWTEYTPAYGRFIRGIDKSGTAIDPDGQRALESIQADMIASHDHQLKALGGAYNAITATVGRVAFLDTADFANASKTNLSGGNETRSKNVALLYCSKN